MRIPSGVTSQYVYFVGVDATDYVTRETGLTTFTVYRSRNGAAAAAMTTPTVNEVDATNMPGVYELLLDEDMTIGSGNDSEEMVFHITATGMAPVTRTIELYRPKITIGQTLATADIASILEDTGTTIPASLSTIDGNVDSILTDTGTTIPATLSTIDGVVDSILTDTGTTIPAQISALNDISAADVNAQVDIALSDYDAPTKTEMDAAFTEIKGATFSGATDSLEAIRDRGDAAWTGGGAAPTVGEIADAVWTEAIADHSGTAGSTAEALAAAGSAGDPWITSLPGSYTGTQAGKILADVLADTDDLQSNQGDWATATGFATSAALATVDSNVDAILLDTNDLQANQGNWLTATVPTATENADALLNRDMSAVSDTNARTPLNALRFLRNKYSITGTTLTVTKENDTTAAWTSALTTNASAEPVTGSDPA